jgi:polyisoprenoid-binding protein YceI
MQRNHLYLLAGFFAFSMAAPAQTTTWTPDKAHSSVSFSVLHLGLSKVRGHFGNVDGSIQIDSADVIKSSVKVTVDVTTVDTGVTARDGDLKGAGFFDVEHFPKATFVSTSVKQNGKDLEVSGDLTLHGVTKPIVLHVEGPLGPVAGMDHKPHSGYSATATIDRTAFDIGAKYPSAVVGDEVNLTIDLDIAKQ